MGEARISPIGATTKAYERLSRVAQLFLPRGGADDLRHAVLVVRLAGPSATGGPLTVGALAALVESRLHLAPARFRRVLRPTPLRLAGPLLVDDADFDIHRHVRSVGDPGPISEARLAELVDRYAGEQLDRRHPLWEIAVPPEIEGGGRAILLKLHHALAEGEGGIASAALLVFDLSPAAEVPVLRPWSAEAAPTPLGAVVLAAEHQAERLASLARACGGLLRSRQRLRDAAHRWSQALAAYRTEIAPKRPTYRFRRPIGPRHATALAVRPTRQVEAIAAAAGSSVTFNDVLLVAIAGGLRRWHAHLGTPPVDLVTQVPVNLRRDEGEPTPTLEEMPSFMAVRLPVAERDPGIRLQLVRAATDRGKRAAPRLAPLSSAVAQLPSSLHRRAAERLYERAPDFHLASIKGPDVDLYVAGHRVELAYLTGRVRKPLRMAALSFAGNLTVSLGCDPDLVPALDVLARSIEEELDGLMVSEGAADPARARRSRS